MRGGEQMISRERKASGEYKPVQFFLKDKQKAELKAYVEARGETLQDFCEAAAIEKMNRGKAGQ
jgi:hypothetical protein